MKKWSLVVLILSVMLIAPSQSGAQRLLKDIKEKAQQKINQKINQEVEEEVNEEIDEKIGIEETDEADREARNQQRTMGLLKGLGVGGEPVPIADSYSFSQLIEMHVESYDGDGKLMSDGNFITLLNKDMKTMAYQATSGEMAEKSMGIFIVDTNNKATIILSEAENKKTGVVFGLDSLASASKAGIEDAGLEDTPEYYAAHPNIKKTGKTKKIAGYTCEQYLLTDEDSEGEAWLTRDLKMNTYDFFSSVFKIEMAATGMGWGYLMESTNVDKTTGEKSIMKVTKIDPDANRKFNMAEYQITNMGNLKMPGVQ